MKATHYKLVNTRLQKSPETRPDSAIIQSFREQLAEGTASKEGILAELDFIRSRKKTDSLARQSRLLRKELLSRTSSAKVWFNHKKVCPSSIILLVRHGNMRSCSFKSRCSFR